MEQQTIEKAQKNSFERIRQMIYPNGIIQHSEYDRPNFDHPSSVDDNTRAAIIYARASKIYSGNSKGFQDVKAMNIFLDYMAGAKKSRTDGLVNNYRMWEDGKFIGRDNKQEDPNALYDCFGRYLWASAEVAGSNYPEEIKQRARKMFEDSFEPSFNLTYPMTKSLVIIGLSKFLKQNPENGEVERVNSNLSYGLSELFKKNSSRGWKGFSKDYTYCAARPAQAMILAGEVLNREEFVEYGRESLDFLVDNTIKEGRFNAIGNDGFFVKGGEPAIYDKQTIEPGVMIGASVDAYKVTGERKYLDNALVCFSSFYGNNIQNAEMVTENGGVLDAITPTGVNQNEGAESIISHMLSLSKFREIDVNPFMNN